MREKAPYFPLFLFRRKQSPENEVRVPSFPTAAALPALCVLVNSRLSSFFLCIVQIFRAPGQAVASISNRRLSRQMSANTVIWGQTRFVCDVRKTASTSAFLQ